MEPMTMNVMRMTTVLAKEIAAIASVVKLLLLTVKAENVWLSDIERRVVPTVVPGAVQKVFFLSEVTAKYSCPIGRERIS